MADRLELDRFLPYRLSVVSNLISDRIAETYRALFGLSIAEWRLIAVTAETGPITPAALGERTRMDKVMVSRAAAALVQRHLLARTPNAQDRRSHLLDLTPAGRDLYGRVAPEAMALERRLLAALSPDDAVTLARLLKRIEDAALR